MKYLQKLNNKAVAFLLITGIFLNLILTILPLRDKYLSTNYWERYPNLKKMYFDSIYANKKGEWIPDEILYAYAGGAFVKGVSPILINPEVPPFGRYLIGLSALIFRNENTINLFFVFATLILLYILGTQIFTSKIIALIPPFLLSFETFFKNQIIHTPLLDIMQLAFLLMYFIVFNKILKLKDNKIFLFILAQMFLGFFISTKFYATGVPIVVSSLTLLILKKDFAKFSRYFLTLPISVIVLLLTYIRVLFTGYPLLDFLGIQKWVFLYNSGHVNKLFTVLPLILFNKWYVWWGSNEILSDPQWTIAWPTITILSIITIVCYVLNKFKKNYAIEIILIWSVIYLIFLNIGNPSARYFVIFFPILYLITIYGIQSIIINSSQPKNIVKK